MMKKQSLFQKIFAAAIAAVFVSSAFSMDLREPREEKLLNGLKVLMWADNKADKVWFRIRVHAGSAFDPQGKEGVMQLLADNLFPTEAAKDAFAEDLGGGLEVMTNYDYIEVVASVKPDSFLTALETLSTAISNPAIDKETTVKLRNTLSEKVRSQEGDPAYVAERTVAGRLFGTFPYGRPQRGTLASLAKIDFADLIDAKARFLTADNATLTVSGNFDSALAYKAIRRYFGGWLKADKKVPSTFRQPDAPPVTLLSIPSPKADAAALRFAMRGVAWGDKDLVSSMIFTSIVESRLKMAVPADHAPDVFVRNEPRTLPGIITIGFAIDKSANGSKVEGNTLLSKALSDPITDNEFQAAKTTVVAAWAKKDQATFWLDAETYKLADLKTYARSADLPTAADVRAYAEKARKQPIVSVLVDNPSK